MDPDMLLAIQLHNELNNDAYSSNHIKKNESPRKKRKNAPAEKNCIVDPEWEITDPNPDIHSLFQVFDRKYFWASLDSVEVKWSPRMYSCAGICTYKGKLGGCVISLSLPLLKLRPRKDLVETLLHEMIHAYLFIADKNRDRGEHGPKFHEHMYRINKEAGTHITVYHSFHDEVKHYKQHWWRCNGPCQNQKPFFGLVKRSMNRAPGPNDFWFAEHQSRCGGEFIKIKEPENFKSRKRTSDKKEENPKKKKVSPNSLTKYFPICPPSAIKNVNTFPKIVPQNEMSNIKINEIVSPNSLTKYFPKSPPSAIKTVNNTPKIVPQNKISTIKTNKTVSPNSLTKYFPKSPPSATKTVNTTPKIIPQNKMGNIKTNKTGSSSSTLDSYFVGSAKDVSNVRGIKNHNTSASVDNYSKIKNVHGFTNLTKPCDSSCPKKGGSVGGTGLKSNKGGTLLLNPKPSMSSTSKTDKNEENKTRQNIDITPFSGKGYVLGGSVPDRTKSRLLTQFQQTPPKVSLKTDNTPSKCSTQGETSIPFELSDSDDEPNNKKVHCPVCNSEMDENLIDSHLETCMQLESVFENTVIEESSDTEEDVEFISATNPGLSSTVNCPVCGEPSSQETINDHLDNCLR